MSARRVLTAALAAAAVLAGAGAGPSRAAEPQWQAVPMPIPAGGLYRAPVGLPGDLKFWAPNRGLMTVGGNNTIPEGIYSWDGVGWHQLATVCGGADNARIAWAGPTEFWTISRPSLPRDQQPGLALCHFKNGAVVHSFSTPEAVSDPYHELLSATCRSASDCWFGGVGAKDGTGQRVGAFHLHWNGTELRTVYAPQGRAVADMLAFGGELFEATTVGSEPGLKNPAELVVPEDPPRLLHRVVGETFANDPFVPSDVPVGAADGGTELRALDGDGQTAWAVGGGSTSGPAVAGQFFARPPVAARLDAGVWTELSLKTPEGDDLDGDQTFADVAAVPGTKTAWAVIRGTDVDGEGGQTLQPSVAHIAEDGQTTVQALVPDGQPAQGAAWRIACPAANDCWMATARGYLYRLTDPAAPPSYTRDTDPAFQGTITVRPNEAAEQTIPDTPPEDDSQPPPPVIITPDPPPDLPPCTPLAPLLGHVKARAPSRFRLVVSFRMRRAARVQLVARHGKRVVARTKLKRLRPGRRSLTLRVSPRRWPTKLRFVVKGDTRPKRKCQGSGTGDGNTFSTGPG